MEFVLVQSLLNGRNAPIWSTQNQGVKLIFISGSLRSVAALFGRSVGGVRDFVRQFENGGGRRTVATRRRGPHPPKRPHATEKGTGSIFFNIIFFVLKKFEKLKIFRFFATLSDDYSKTTGSILNLEHVLESVG